VRGLGGAYYWRLGRVLDVGSVVLRGVRMLLLVGYVC
jgi:hypothetical protein